MRPRGLLAIPTLALGLGLGLVGCSESGGTKVAVTGTDDGCTPETTELAAGKTTFVFTNKAKDVSELYVKTGDDKVLKEVENVTTGTKREITVNLKAGEYKLVCKPGMKGDGIATELTVTGEGGGDDAEPADRTIAFEAVDFAFENARFAVQKGETIEFHMTNNGTVEHEFEVLGPDGQALGEIGETEPGRTGEVTLTFSKSGTYTFICDVEDHKSRGMTGTFSVVG